MTKDGPGVVEHGHKPPVLAVVVLLSLLTLMPSMQIAFNSGGLRGMLIYVGAIPSVFATLFLMERWPPLGTRVRRYERVLLAMTVLAMIVAFSIRYPMSQAGLLGLGSDRDEALDIGVERLLSGLFPYYARTYLGLPLTPMPGALVLAAPFHLLGAAAWQNLLWLPVGLALFVHAAARFQTRAAFAVAALVGNIAVVQDYLHGGDLGVNAIYVAAALWVVHGIGAQSAPRPQALALAGVLLAVAVVSRPIFATAAILAVSYMAGRQGLRTAIIFSSFVALTIAALVLPFLLYDAAAFFPRHLLKMVPPRWAGTCYALIAAGMLVAAAPLVWKPTELRSLYALMAISLGLMLALPVAIDALGNTRMLTYATPACFFGMLAVLSYGPSYSTFPSLNRRRQPIIGRSMPK